MIRLIGCAILIALPSGVHAATDCGQPAAVCEQAVPGALALVREGAPAAILADPGDFPGVLRAARDLQSDLSAVAGAPAAYSTDASPPGRTAIIVGTLGRSARVDRIVRERGIDVAGVAGRWEAHLLQVVERPEPGVDRALLIAGADRRGTIFGIYELSRRLGVSPWAWWADVPVPRRATLHAAPGRFIDAPAVRYRGIFLNDEEPALGGWARAKFGGTNHQFYEHVFELILRLKGNALWPAMWGKSIADDDPRSPVLADEYGVVIATSHHEPMMRAHVEWERHGEGAWDYTRNAATLREFWREGIERMGSHESLVTIGMRGDGDEPMTRGTAIELLERIVADQRGILADVTGQPAEHTPQVWALYKEVQDYFDAGMRVPDDVMLLFADDNWGNLRRLPAPGERRAGGYGVYYHFDYVGGPRNYKWINTVQNERTWEQMQLAWAHGADRLWIVNVGDLKPQEFPVSFFLDHAWNPAAFTVQRLQGYAAEWAAAQFGDAHAREIGELLTRYTQYNARRKPELLSPETYSLTHFHEAERVLADWEALCAQALRIGAALGARYRDAWYQLVEYPVLASANLNALYVAVARNRLYAAQGRASANAWAEEARRLFARDAELARVYEQEIAGGKWIHMMSQPRIGYVRWQQPDANVMPALVSLEVPQRAALGLAVEGDRRAWPEETDAAVLPVLDPFGAAAREIVLFNRGRAALQYTATPAQPWLRVQPAAGDVGDERRLRVEVDWSAAPVGEHMAGITVRGSDGSEVQVDVPLFNPPGRDAVSGFVESNGYIAIEAAHYARAVATPGLQWQVIPDLGRTLSGVTSVPVAAPAQAAGGDGMRLEYPLWLHGPGEVEVRVVLSPTLDYQHRGGVRYAVSFGDEPPQVVTVRIDPTPGHADFRAWERAVSDSVHVAVSRHRVGAGAQTLKLWRVDPGVVVQRLEISRGTLPPSYLGPPESPRREARRPAGEAVLPATLQQAYAGDFLVGAAVNDAIVSARDAAARELVVRHFNTITAENVMKAEVLNPRPGVFDFSAADAFVDFGRQHGMFIVGHTLVWHNQTPAGFFTGADGRPNPPAAQIEVMRAYIEKVAGHFAGRVQAWDVVNEVIGEDGAYRADTAWVKAIGDGDELVRQAFRFAHQYAPDAELYYNDFNAERPVKRDAIVRMVRMLQSHGIRIDGIGIQAHWGLNYPDLADIEAAIDAYAALGVKVMITELDIDVLPLTREGQLIGTGLSHPQFQLPEFRRYLDPYRDGLPPDVERRLADRYAELFRLFHRKRDQLARVTLWGVHDGMSWKNDYPVPGRTNYPLLFDRERRPKPAFDAVLEVSREARPR